jgi:Putative Actinobacterial Holin-X, holin superfamily III
MTTVPSHNGSELDSDRDVADFFDDLLTLAELHAKLTVVDFAENARRAALPLGLTFASLTIMAASVPVVLLGLALMIATGLIIRQEWAMVLVAGGAVVLACSVAVFGLVRLRRGFDGFRTSRKEFWRNLVWLRDVLFVRRRLHQRRGI